MRAEAGARSFTEEGTRNVLLRGLSILECFDEDSPVLGVTEIAERAGLPMATTHRLLATLVDWGAVERTGRGRYRLGLRMWRLGARVPQARVLRDVALPYLEDLYEATHHVVHLAVRDHLEVLYVEKITGRHATPVTSVVGRRLPLHATGPGKVLLAYGGAKLFDEVVAEGLSKVTASTITDPAALRRALAEIRRIGHAVSRQEASEGNSSVAVPIFDRNRLAVASISVVVPDREFSSTALAPAVMAVGRAISRTIGGDGPRGFDTF